MYDVREEDIDDVAFQTQPSTVANLAFDVQPPVLELMKVCV